jgi:hypothetical protein
MSGTGVATILAQALSVKLVHLGNILPRFKGGFIGGFREQRYEGADNGEHQQSKRQHQGQEPKR